MCKKCTLLTPIKLYSLDAIISIKDAENKAFAEYEDFKVMQDKSYVSDFGREVKKLLKDGLEE